MAKRQQRIPVAGFISPEILGLSNTWCTLVKMNNSVIFAEILSCESEKVRIKTQLGKKLVIPAVDIREIIIDRHA